MEAAELRAIESANAWDPSASGCSSENPSAFGMLKRKIQGSDLTHKLGFQPVSEGKRHKSPKGRSQQKAVRTNDLRALGDTKRSEQMDLHCPFGHGQRLSKRRLQETNIAQMPLRKSWA